MNIRKICLSALILSASPIWAQISMDEVDRAGFRASGPPWEKPAAAMASVVTQYQAANSHDDISLDGVWSMACGGNEKERLAGEWNDAIDAKVPGSVHNALWEAGLIPDPYFGRNDSIAEQQSYKTWWLKKDFEINGKPGRPKLIFGGIANKCAVWINGRLLGEHEGMFGGPEFDITRYVRQGKNTVVVRIDPIPQIFEPEGTFFGGANKSWQYTVVCNCVYGWHYSKIPPLGIWRNVRISDRGPTRIENLFVVTNSLDGDIILNLDLSGTSARVKGTLYVTVAPETFEGNTQYFEYPVLSARKSENLNLSLKIDDPRLWWPNDMGKQDLYRMKLSFVPAEGHATHAETTFGIRTVEMAPFPEGPRPDLYNWTFVINGRPMFVKGTGWCTMNPLLDFPRERYDHFLTIARLQHVQILRAWGGGIPETEEFYDLCDRYGIMVIQEWPTAWDSHNTQPFEMLKETVELNTLRLRNHPSLVMWGAGNESGNPVGPAIDMMGRLSIELDGTRPFHRGEAWGGSAHNYNCWWDDAHLNHNLNMTSRFWGEFGIASLPHMETISRYLPESEQNEWPPREGGSFLHHMPIFGQVGEFDKLKQYGGYFTPGTTMADFVTGSQLAQVVGVRHTLERARTMWPHTTGALYYKMNDNYPATSWSCVDFYGAIKPVHYFVRNSFSPVAAVMLFDRTNLSSQETGLPLFLLDDTGALEDSNVKVAFKCYDYRFNEVAKEEFEFKGTGEAVNRLGTMELGREQTRSLILLFTAEVIADGEQVFRTFYFANTEVRPGSLFNLPRTTLTTSRSGNEVTVSNTGDNPAVGVNITSPGNEHRLIASDSFFWLNPGESRTVNVNISDSVSASCWNMEGMPWMK